MTQTLAQTILSNDNFLEEIVLKSKDSETDYLVVYFEIGRILKAQRPKYLEAYPIGSFINFGQRCLKKPELVRILEKLL